MRTSWLTAIWNQIMFRRVSGSGDFSQLGLDIATVASASAVSGILTLPASPYVIITGSTPLSGFASIGVGTLVKTKFSGNVPLTSGANFIIPGGSLTTAGGDVFIWFEESAGVWRRIGGNTLFSDYGSQDFTYVNFTPAGTAALENITGAGKEFPFTSKFTGVYELEWGGCVFPGVNTTDEVNVAVAASIGSPTVIRKTVAYIYASAGDIRRDYHAKTLFSLVAGTAYTFNVQVSNLTAARAVSVGYNSGSSTAKWFIKRIA